MYQLIETNNQKKNLKNELKELSSCLCEYLNFDNWKIIMFTRDKRYGFLQYSSKNDIELSYDSQEKIFFDRSKHNSYLNLILDEKKIIYHHYNNNSTFEYNPLSKDALIELYFPLFLINDSKEDVIGCFYLSKSDYLKDDVTELLSNKYVATQITNIQRILRIFYSEYIDNLDFLNQIHILKEIIKAREPQAASHPFNVAYLCNLMGLELGFTPDRLYKLYMAATLHDLGEVFIPESTLSKKGSMTAIEKSEMQRHPIHSYNILKVLADKHKKLLGIEEIVLQHHERYDGTGYPNGLKGEEILLESRILAIADAVDAMLSERSYKKPKSINRVIRELVFNKNKQFDPVLAQMMVEILSKNLEKHEVILKQPITIGAIELSTKENSCQLQGTLIKTNLGYRFKIDCSECSCPEGVPDLPDIVSVAFFTENNGKIYEYSASLEYKDEHNIYISKLDYKPTYDYFSLLWELKGVLTIKNSLLSEATISSIGGDSLCFYINKDQFNDKTILNNTNNVTITFEDDSTITVAGKITKIIEVNCKLFCDFKYLNILEGTRDKIFKHIFEKQAKLRTGLLYPREQ